MGPTLRKLLPCWVSYFWGQQLHDVCICPRTFNGSFLKWWVSPTTMAVPTKNDQLWGVLEVPPCKETPKWQMEKVSCVKMSSVELTINVDNAMKTYRYRIILGTITGIPDFISAFWQRWFSSFFPRERWDMFPKRFLEGSQFVDCSHVGTTSKTKSCHV